MKSWDEWIAVVDCLIKNNVSNAQPMYTFLKQQEFTELIDFLKKWGSSGGHATDNHIHLTFGAFDFIILNLG